MLPLTSLPNRTYQLWKAETTSYSPDTGMRQAENYLVSVTDERLKIRPRKAGTKPRVCRLAGMNSVNSACGGG